MRELTFTQALLEAQDQILEHHPECFIIGEGVPDPKGVFGTTLGLDKKYPGRVFDSPVSEAGVTGVCIGAALNGLHPIQVHQRMDFSLYAMDQIVNNLAKWKSMFGLERDIPMVIRMTVGRGWGAGNQHAQNLEALYAHIPGLQILVPHDATSAKGLLIRAVLDKKPTIFIEHKWLHNNISKVDPKFFPDNEDIEIIPGGNITLVSWGAATRIAKRAAEMTGAELLILKRLPPGQWGSLFDSINKTKKLIVISDAWRTNGFASEVITQAAERCPKTIVNRITLEDKYVPSSHLLSDGYYPDVNSIIATIKMMTGEYFDYESQSMIPHDVDPNIGKVVSAI